MEFTSLKKAAAIAEERGLLPQAVYVWQHRGRIPDRVWPSREKRELSNLSDLQKVRNFKAALDSEKFNIAALAELSNHGNTASLCDIKRGKIQCYKEDLIAYTRAINIVRVHAKNVLAALERYPERETTLELLKDFLTRREMREYVLFNRDKKLYSRFQAWIRGARRYPIEDCEALKTCLVVFIAETVI